MKLIIDISDKMFDTFKKHGIMAFDHLELGLYDQDQLAVAIANGTPYNPQGDLISREALLKRVDEERKYLIARGQTGAEHILVHNFRDLIKNAPTVKPESCRECPFVADEEKQITKESPQGECCGSCYLCDVGDCGADMRKGSAE